jgi:hypothetical protein
MKVFVRASLAAACIIAMLIVTWWISRQLEADACLDGGHVFDWRRGRCDFAAERLPGPTQWYDRRF